MLPFLVYGLIILVPLVLLMSPFNLTNMERNPGLWVVALVMLPSIYTSYRDIFREVPAAPVGTVGKSGGSELGVFQREPLHAGIAEIDLHSGVGAAAFGADDYAGTEFGMHDVLPYPPAGYIAFDCRRLDFVASIETPRARQIPRIWSY